jgi:serine/threonine protein kinase
VSGSGAYSSVYKVRRYADGIEYAMKKVDILDIKRHSLMKPLLCYGNYYWIIKRHFSIVMEYADGGDIF